MRIPIRVKPGSSRTRVGGCHADDHLVVAVAVPAVDGRANKAVLDALAKALGVRAWQLEIVHGHTSRSKVVDVPDELVGLVDELRRS